MIKFKSDKYYKEFQKEIAEIFSFNDELWSCEFCKWIDCDDRICNICKKIMDCDEHNKTMEQIFKNGYEQGNKDAWKKAHSDFNAIKNSKI